MNSIIGKILRGRYYIVKELGKGGFSVTYLSQDRDLPGYPLCVVKRLQPRINDRVSWQNAQKRFITEANVLQKLGEHPQIPKLLAYFEENQEFYLVQEFIDGDNLEEEINEKLLSETEASEVLKDVLEILKFVHEHNVIHRDIKPSNLIRRHQDRRIVLIDFGAVKEITVSSGLAPNANWTNIIGTIGYMAPEQIAGQPNLSSDIYALGKTILYSLTRQLIDEDSSTLDVMNHPSLGKISPKLTNILNTMTKQSYYQRYQSVADVLQELNKKEFSIPVVDRHSLDLGNEETAISNSFNNNLISSSFNNRRKKSKKFKLKIPSLLSIALVILGFISVLFFLSTSNRKSIEEAIAYKAIDYGFQIEYPKTWTKQDVEDPITGEIVAFISPSEGEYDLFQERIVITIEDLPNNLKTLEDYKEELIDKLRDPKNNALTIEEERKIKISDRPAYKIVYSRKDGQIELQQMEVFTIKNNQVYVLTYSAERAKYSKFLKIAQDTIKSFVLD
jgi:serine/threonine protein kinase